MNSQIIQDFQVVSWNIGRDSDYLGLNVRNRDAVKWDTTRDLGKIRTRLFSDVFRQMADSFKPDFFCLQEVKRAGDVKNWLGDQYELCATFRDCVIAWDKDKYELVEGSQFYEIEEGRYLILELFDKSTQKVIRIASAHLWGFNLNNPHGKDRYSEDPETLKGDCQLKELVKQLNSPAYLTIIGLDANTTPEIHPDRLAILEERGFIRDATEDEVPTAFNSSLPDQSAHLDYLFAKGSKKVDVEVEAFVSQELPIESPEVNPSDHSPILSTVKLVEKKKDKNFMQKILHSFKNTLQ